jgi:hypothetical protein
MRLILTTLDFRIGAGVNTSLEISLLRYDGLKKFFSFPSLSFQRENQGEFIKNKAFLQTGSNANVLVVDSPPEADRPLPA